MTIATGYILVGIGYGVRGYFAERSIVNAVVDVVGWPVMVLMEIMDR